MRKNRMCGRFAALTVLFAVMALLCGGAWAQGEPVSITSAEELVRVLSSTDASATQGNDYSLDADVIIDTNTLRDTLAPDEVRVFAGVLNGNGHTITVSGSGNYAPLFEQLRGSVTNVNIVFEGDVTGTPFAYDVSYQDPAAPVTLSGIRLTVNGSVLYADHDYTAYYASILSSSYGNWYIHFGAQPVHLATGFAWYLWGASVSDVQVHVTGTVGGAAPSDGDATAAGFAYFALKGASTAEVRYQDVSVNADGGIICRTGDGHAAAYGFATGTIDGSTAGFGSSELDETARVSVTAQSIQAFSQQGAASAVGFARFAQGYTHDCTVTAPGGIRAECAEGDAEEDQYAYMNGEAYAYGFILYTGGHSIEARRSFTRNRVSAGEIVAKTESSVYAGPAFAGGFAHQMMNSSSSVPDLSYNTNQVNVTGNIEARANAAGAVTAGFVTSSGNDTSNRPDHIHDNTVTVGGSIIAVSQAADATATGYSYRSSTHRRACSVTVEGDIVAESPVQAVAAGFNGLQNVGSNYFINESAVTVRGSIRAVQTGDQEGIAVAGGLNAVIMQGTSGSASTRMTFNDNRVEVGGTVEAVANANAASQAEAGLLIGLSEHGDSSKGMFEVSRNTFTGQEALIAISDADRGTYPGEYTPFTGSSSKAVYSAAQGNRVTFLRSGACPLSADVTLEHDAGASPYGDLWALSGKTIAHGSAVRVEEKKPTCTEDGNILYWYCETCGKYYSDEALTQQITKEQTVLKATGHQYGAWQTDESRHWHACAVCGVKADEGAHTFEWIVDREATESQAGSKHEECTVCGYRKAAVEIPATGGGQTDPGTQTPVQAPQTGDEGTPVLWLALLVASGVAVLAVLVVMVRRASRRR